jgi:hypothetical protein
MVFDLDETLGYFVELSIFWKSIIKYFCYKKINYILTQNDFIAIIELYPEFIRPNIVSILNYIKNKKYNKECEKVLIYTNNTGSKEWVNYIKGYFEYKLKSTLFDNIIYTSKTTDSREPATNKNTYIKIEKYEKNIKEIITYTQLSKDVQICFLDNSYYPNMNCSNVYYIKLNSYIHKLSYETMIGRFMNAKLELYHLLDKIQNKQNFIEFMITNMNNFKFTFIEKTKTEYEIDKTITKEIMLYLQLFFTNIMKNNAIN